MKNTMMEKKNTVWKKALILSSAMLMGISLMACGGKGAAKTETGKTEVSTESQKAGEKADEKKTEELKGSISDIKDFMFTITTKEGKSYALNFDKKPEGLSDVKDGDDVVVEYTGKLSEVDPFEGEILSVKKA